MKRTKTNKKRLGLARANNNNKSVDFGGYGRTFSKIVFQRFYEVKWIDFDVDEDVQHFDSGLVDRDQAAVTVVNHEIAS